MSSTPADEAAFASQTRTILLGFDEPVFPGASGNITLKVAGGANAAVFDIRTYLTTSSRR